MFGFTNSSHTGALVKNSTFACGYLGRRYIRGLSYISSILRPNRFKEMHMTLLSHSLCQMKKKYKCKLDNFKHTCRATCVHCDDNGGREEVVINFDAVAVRDHDFYCGEEQSGIMFSNTIAFNATFMDDSDSYGYYAFDEIVVSKPNAGAMKNPYSSVVLICEGGRDYDLATRRIYAFGSRVRVQQCERHGCPHWCAYDENF